MKRVDLIYFDVTSGHRSSALAIEKALNMLDEPVETRVLNFTDVLKHHTPLQMLANAGINLFNWGVRYERAYFAAQQVGLFQIIQALVPPSEVRKIAKFWQHDRPDVVVSVMPICNLMLERTLHAVYPDCPYVVIPVDYEEPQRNYWFDTRMDALYINPTLKLAEQAAAAGVRAECQITVKGMPIDPLFYQSPDFDAGQALTRLGLDPANPTVLVGFGGQGSVLVKQCAEALFKVNRPLNVVFLCGRHQSLYDEISAMKTPYPKLVLSFMPEAPAYYYHLADVIVGKPGSMTITEAVVTHTPILAVESKSLAIVQRGNEVWLRRSGVGEVIHIPDLVNALHRVLSSSTVQQNIEREWHQGVFDIARIITQIAYGSGLQANNKEAA